MKWLRNLTLGLLIIFVIFIVALNAGCIPKGKQTIPVPYYNTLSEEKIALGKRLFFDPNLSNPPGVACGTCHVPKLATTDGKRIAVGVFGREGIRNTPAIITSAINDFQFWDGRSASLEDQALKPITNPVEMNNTWDQVITYLEKDPGYKASFKKIFDGDITTTNVVKALASYERSLLPELKTPYHRYVKGEKSALSSSAKRGMKIFFSKGNCGICHVPPYFTDSDFHNTGVAQTGTPDLGRYLVTKAADDLCKFKTPSLINVALTAPYAHAGKADTLEQVVEFYNRGGDLAPAGTKSEYMKVLNLASGEKEDLVNFLKALTLDEDN